LDLLVIDESARSAAMPTPTIRDITVLQEWQRHGDIDLDTAWMHRLDNLMQNERGSSADLRQLGVSGLRLLDGTRTEHFYMRRALSYPPGLVRKQFLDSAPSTRALHALIRGNTQGFHGAYVSKMGLHLPSLRGFDVSQARTTLVLDATPTPPELRRFFAKYIVPFELQTRSCVTPRVTQVVWNASTRLIRSLNTPAGGPPAKLTFGSPRDEWRLEALVERYDSPDTLWVLHKKWRSAKPPCVAEAEKEGRVTHFGSKDSRGSNRWEKFTTVVALAFYVPRAVQHSFVEMLGEDATADDAEYALQTAPIIQAITRIRPFNTSGKHVVIVDERPLPGFEPNEVLNVDVLAMNEVGAMPYAELCMQELALQEVARRGFLAHTGYSTTLRLANDRLGFFHEVYCGSTSGECSPQTYGRVTSKFVNGVRHHFDNFDGLAIQLGLATSTATAIIGGRKQSIPLHHRPSAPPTVEQLAFVVHAALKPEVLFLGGRRLRLRATPLLRAVALVDQATVLTTAALAEAADKSRRTIQKWIKKEEETLESLDSLRRPTTGGASKAPAVDPVFDLLQAAVSQPKTTAVTLPNLAAAMKISVLQLLILMTDADLDLVELRKVYTRQNASTLADAMLYWQ
jgi:hypothetical protein